ncbi:conserved phage C-terminal domain-containing protein [Clostridium sardiniense]|uniref:conserved phage C-terminal domain-containing protein n=1 Tax=Clostridium sardiniense TaxID=29369 RepID=UPI003D324CD4
MIWYKLQSNSKKTISLIEARLNEGFTLDDFKKVILNKKGSWQGTNYEVYLRPSTLFSGSKFEEYLNEKRAKKEEKNKGIYDIYKPFFEED